MPEAARLERLRRDLSQPPTGLFVAPIRHHSPACAWAVRALIRTVRPRHVLVEAPCDLTRHVDALLDGQTRPPVAIAILHERKGYARRVSYYPFCTHSPEFVALSEGRRIGAKLAFIDLPSAHEAMRSEDDAESGGARAEAYFDSGDYVAALCRRLGCRNGFELWDHLFESRLGDTDWRGFLADVGAYCAALRLATSDELIERNGDAARERHMRSMLAATLREAEGAVVAVVGAFHAPALTEAGADGRSEGRAEERAEPEPMRAPGPATAPAPTRKAAAGTDSYLIRYGFEALDALSGYSAGLPQPGYYEHLWRCANEAEGMPHWRHAALDLVSGFARRARVGGHEVNVPAQVEILRVAEALALMRGHRGVARYDLIDAVRTVLVKGEAGAREVWTERLLAFLRGAAIGDVPACAGSPPLVEDARRRAAALRIDVSDGARRKRRLDIRRKPSHLAASRFFHAMTLLETRFAERLMGPDLLHGVQIERLFEEWSYAWSPRVEAALIERAVHADRVPAACLAVLEQRRDEMQAEGLGRDIVSMAELFVQGLLAGLGVELAPFVRALSADIQAHGDFPSVAYTLRRLHYVRSATGPLAAPKELDLDGVTEAAYLRLIYLCDGLPELPEESLPECIEALRTVAELLRGADADRFDHGLFDDAIERAARSARPGQLLGAALAICVQSGRRSAEALAAAIEGAVAGTADDAEERIASLRGMLHAAPDLLWQHDRLLRSVDRVLCELSNEAFLELLPHVRLAFTNLNPREADRLAAQLAQMHGLRAADFAPQRHALRDEDLARGIAIESELRASFEADGLGAWLGTNSDEGSRRDR
jgi:hypothetical protein